MHIQYMIGEGYVHTMIHLFDDTSLFLLSCIDRSVNRILIYGISPIVNVFQISLAHLSLQCVRTSLITMQLNFKTCQGLLQNAPNDQNAPNVIWNKPFYQKWCDFYRTDKGIEHMREYFIVGTPCTHIWWSVESHTFVYVKTSIIAMIGALLYMIIVVITMAILMLFHLAVHPHYKHPHYKHLHNFQSMHCWLVSIVHCKR